MEHRGHVLVLAVVGIVWGIVAEPLAAPTDSDAMQSTGKLGNEWVEGMFVAETTRHEH